jgi:ketosteroid isomerase-like protein
VTPEETLALVRASYEAMNARDLAGFLATVHPEAEVRSLVLQPAGSDAFRGYAGVREWWNTLLGTQDGFELALVSVRVDGDLAVTELLASNVVGGVRVQHTMWQGVRLREGRFVWWAIFPTEGQASEAIGLASGAGAILAA